MNGTSGRIYVVDDDAAVRESIEALLWTAGFETVACESASRFFETFDPTNAVCILLDVRMPGTDGLALLEALGSRRQGVPVVMVTGHGDVPMAARAMRAGAADFIEKPFKPDHLVRSIERAINVSAPSASAAPDPTLREAFAQLTPREMEVMHEMVIGHPNKIIAHNLGMSARTVEIHRGRVMQKTGAESLSHLVRMAMRAGYDPELP